MNKSLIAVLLLVCGGALCAQVPADRTKAAAAKKTGAVTAAAPAAQPEQPAAQPKKAVKAELAKAAAPKPSEQDAEESVVMIDSKAEAEDEGAAVSYNAEQDERAVPGGLPSSFGQCKGVVNDAGRTVLIFESPDDGSVYFVQVTLGRANVSWKLIDRIPRSAD